jgi:xanthine dehydrogenase accessory factor
MTGKPQRAAVLLAAGASTRMGAVKALLDAGGRPLVRAVCERLLEAGCDRIIAVLGHHRQAIEPELPKSDAIRVVVNPDPDRGQVSSMALGLRAAADEGAPFALVALVDQPPVDRACIEVVARAAAVEPSAVHLPTFGAARGHPSALPTALASELSAARPGEGARDVIARLGVPVREHPVDDPGIALDLDTPEDVARWRGAAPPKPSPVPTGPVPPTGPDAPHTDGELFAEAARRSAAREPFVLCTVVATDRSAPREAGAKMLVGPDGSFAGTVGGGPLEASVLFEAARLLREQGVSTVLDFALADAGDRAVVLPARKGKAVPLDEEALALGMKCGGAVSIFLDVVRPAPRLLVYGAGHVGERVAAIASEAGLHTVVIDDRPGFVTRDRFPRARELICSDLAQDPLGGLQPGSEDFVTIVTRCHDLDEGVLQAALGSRARYVGLIGSRRKVAVILKSIEARTGRDPRADERLHAPIGLQLGDKSPGEIAVSIVAEVLLLKSGAPDLRHNRLPPHAPSSESGINRTDVRPSAVPRTHRG